MTDTRTPVPAPPLPGDRPFRRWLLPATILGLAVIVRLAGIDRNLWMDEAGSHAQATAPNFIAMARDYDHPPLYFALLRGGFQLTDSFTLLRLFSVACGLATVALLCFWPGSRGAAWPAGLLVATSPHFILHAQELRQYALLLLALAAALAFAWRLAGNPGRKSAIVGLAAALAVAAATHLLTVFFMVALAAVLLWLVRRQGLRQQVVIGAAFLPAAMLVAFFKWIFLQQTDKSPDRWWMPAVSWELLADVFREITGWNALVRLADGCERHLPGSGLPFLILAGTAAGFVAWTAWCHRSAAPAWRLLAVAVIFWSLLIGYSLASVPLVWPRILLAGMLPLFLSLGLGIASQPAVRQRMLAGAAIAGLGVAMTVPWLRGLAQESGEDLRGLAATLRHHAQPGDLIVFVGGTEWGVRPYWPDFATRPHVKIDIREPLPQALAPLQPALDQKPLAAATLLIYREDYYLHPRRAVLDEIVRQLSSDMEPAELWNRDAYRLLRFAPRP